MGLGAWEGFARGFRGLGVREIMGGLGGFGFMTQGLGGFGFMTWGFGRFWVYDSGFGASGFGLV